MTFLIYMIMFLQTKQIYMNIEIFPAEKSCEQGCSTCPLARKDSIITAKSIDQKVQNSFSLVERLLGKQRIPYNLHFPSAFELFPKVRHPGLIKMARFESGKKMYTEGEVTAFSQKIKNILHQNNIRPAVIGISAVPHFPVLSATEERGMHLIVADIGKWHFTKGNREIEFTMRSNLIKTSLFEEVIPQLISADRAHIHGMLSKIGIVDDTKSGIYTGTSIGRVYQSRHVGLQGTNSINITNRVIASFGEKESTSSLMDQVYELYPRFHKDIDLAIAPKGVMLMHSSLSINNPIFWMEHYDFQRTLLNAVRKPNFSWLKFVQTNLVFNACAFESIRKVHKGKKISANDFPHHFFRFRKHQLGKNPRTRHF